MKRFIANWILPFLALFFGAAVVADGCHAQHLGVKHLPRGRGAPVTPTMAIAGGVVMCVLGVAALVDSARK